MNSLLCLPLRPTHNTQTHTHTTHFTHTHTHACWHASRARLPRSVRALSLAAFPPGALVSHMPGTASMTTHRFAYCHAVRFRQGWRGSYAPGHTRSLPPSPHTHTPCLLPSPTYPPCLQRHLPPTTNLPFMLISPGPPLRFLYIGSIPPTATFGHGRSGGRRVRLFSLPATAPLRDVVVRCTDWRTFFRQFFSSGPGHSHLPFAYVCHSALSTACLGPCRAAPAFQAPENARHSQPTYLPSPSIYRRTLGQVFYTFGTCTGPFPTFPMTLHLAPLAHLPHSWSCPCFCSHHATGQQSCPPHLPSPSHLPCGHCHTAPPCALWPSLFNTHHHLLYARQTSTCTHLPLFLGFPLHVALQEPP